MSGRKTNAVGAVTSLLTAKQFSKRFGVSLGWIYMHKEVPAMRVGKRLMFQEDELMNWFKQQATRQA